METSHNFERICRTCMLQSASLLSLFDDNSQCTESTQMLTSFTTVKVTHKYYHLLIHYRYLILL